MFLHFLFFIVILQTVLLNAGWKEKVEEHAPTILGPFVVPIAVGTLPYFFTKSKESQLSDLNDISTTIQNSKSELTIIKNCFEAAQFPDIKNKIERQNAKEFIKQQQKNFYSIYKKMFKENNEGNNQNNPLWVLKQSLDDLQNYIKWYTDLKAGFAGHDDLKITGQLENKYRAFEGIFK